MSRANLGAMRGPLTYDDVEDLVVAESPQEHEAAAQQLTRWAQETHPDDGVSPAGLLAAAAEHHEQRGDTEQELEALRAAVSAEGDAPPDTRVWLHEALVRRGRLEEAQQVAAEIRRSRPCDADVYDLVGQAYEAAGELETANRWFTMGLTRLSRREPGTVDDHGLRRLALSRSRVRRELGHPPDETDALAQQQLEAYRRELDAMTEPAGGW